MIVFDVWSSFGYFRRHYTTTSASTNPFLPRSAAEGLIAAIIGYRSGQYPDLLWDAKIAVEIRGPKAQAHRVTKIPLGISYTHSDFWQEVRRYLKRGGNLNHVPVPRSIEILREPAYRLYFSSEHSEVHSQLVQNLREHRTYYTPYFGSSNMLANFEFVGEYDVKMETEGSAKPERVVSIVPFCGKMPRVKVEPNSRYAIEQNLPLHLSKERKPTGYYSAIYSPVPGQSIVVSDTPLCVFEVDGDERKIVFIPTTASPA